jgi:hypothetical protein
MSARVGRSELLCNGGEIGLERIPCSNCLAVGNRKSSA